MDNLTSLDFSALLEHHRATKAVLTIATHIEPFQIPFGQVSIKDGEIVDYREKAFTTSRSSDAALIALAAPIAGPAPFATLVKPQPVAFGGVK